MMSLRTLDYEPRPEFDTKRFVARYLQVLAWVSIASMIAGAIFLDSLSIDFSPILLFWAASALKRRSRTARKWVLGIGGLALVCVIVMLVVAAIFGTEGMSVSLAGDRINKPEVWQVALVALPIGVVVAIPVAILMSERARRQFAIGRPAGKGATFPSR